MRTLDGLDGYIVCMQNFSTSEGPCVLIFSMVEVFSNFVFSNGIAYAHRIYYLFSTKITFTPLNVIYMIFSFLILFLTSGDKSALYDAF